MSLSSAERAFLAKHWVGDNLMAAAILLIPAAQLCAMYWWATA